MFGRAPSLPACPTVYPQELAAQPFTPPAVPQQPFSPPAQPQTAVGGAWQPSAGAGTTYNRQPTYRGMTPDESLRPVLQPLNMPSPGQLGVAGHVRAGEVDWADAHRRLTALGAECFCVEKLPQGNYRMVCILPTGQSGLTHRIEARASTEAEAVSQVMAQCQALERNGQ
jgi:hypothetical protein